jgi:hypothetical protein
MNDEKRPQPLMTDRLLGEERLSRLYQETTTAMPPPGLDAAILDAARQASRQKPRRGSFLALRKWTVPLSLAAALIVTIGVVRSLRHELTSSALVTQTPAAPRSSSTARVDAQDETLLKRHEQKQEQVKEAPAVAQSLRETPAPATQAPLSAAGLARSAPTERQGRRDDAKLQVQELARPEKEEGVASSLHAPNAAFQSVPESRKKTNIEGTKKDELSLDELPLDEWIAEIKKLRQAGKMVEAEANLKAFKQRYPTYPVEKALALPHKSHTEQKGAR